MMRYNDEDTISRMMVVADILCEEISNLSEAEHDEIKFYDYREHGDSPIAPMLEKFNRLGEYLADLDVGSA